MPLQRKQRTVKSLRAEIDRMAAWLDRLHAKYEGRPPKHLVDAAFAKLNEAVRGLYELEQPPRKRP